MAESDIQGLGTPQSPWLLRTPSGQSEFQAYQALDLPALVVLVGYRASLPPTLPHRLARNAKSHGARMALGSADEQKPRHDRMTIPLGAGTG